MIVEKLMTRFVATCRPEDSLQTAAQRMWDYDCGALPVVGPNAEVLGIVTDRDVCMSALMHGLPLAGVPIEWAMAREVKTIRARDSVADAERLMQEFQIRRLPVVDESMRLCGIVSLNDIALASESVQGTQSPELGAISVEHTLASISRHRETSPH